MKKLSLILLTLTFFAALAIAKTPQQTQSAPQSAPVTVASATPPTGPPPGDSGDDFDAPPPPPGQPNNSGEVWKKFEREHPNEARQLTKICKQNPQLRCSFGGQGMGAGQGMGHGRGGMGPGQGMGDMRHGAGPGMGMGQGMGPGMGRGGMGMGQGPGMCSNMDIPAQMEKLQQLRKEARDLGLKFQQAANADEKKKIETELRTKLEAIYTLRLELMKDRVKCVETHLDMVKTELANYEKDKNGVTNSWFDQLTGKSNYTKF